tara:strand:- start:380 stop:643 length:264 start_codon:yes stop_codon:yes gene_type:complete
MMQLRNISFQYHNQNIANVIVNKDKKKFMIMTQFFDHHWPVLRELVQGLEDKFKKPIYDIIQFDDKTFPLAGVFEIIDVHFNIRQEI